MGGGYMDGCGLAGQLDPTEMNVPLNRMLTFIPRGLVYNGQKTKLIRHT